jgi:hypothetical protein
MTTATAENRGRVFNGGIALLLWMVALAVFSLTATTTCGCDEPQTANIVQYSTSWAQMWSFIIHDGNPPLIYAVLRVWSTLFGCSDSSFKACVILIASLTPALLYAGLRRDLGARTAAVVALSVTFCAAFVHHSQLVRSYGLVILLGLGATLQLQALLSRPQSWPRRFAYAALMAAIPYAHLSGLVVWCGHAALFLWRACRRRLDRFSASVWLGSMLAAAAVVTPLFLPPVSTMRSMIVQNVLGEGVYPWVLFIILPRLAMLAGEDANLSIALIAAACIFWISFVIVLRNRQAMRERWPSFDAELWIVVFVGMLVGEMIMASRLLREVYVVHFTIPMILIIALACELIFAKLTHKYPFAAAILTLGLLLPLSMPQLLAMHKHRQLGVVLAAGIVNAEAQKQAQNHKPPPYLVVSREWYCTGVARYIDPDIPYVGVPTLGRTQVIDYLQILSLNPTESLDKLHGVLKEKLAAGYPVFHLYALPPKETPTDAFRQTEEQTSAALESWLSKEATLVKTETLPDCAKQIVLSEYR